MNRDTKWSILPAVAALGMLGLGIWERPAVAQLAPWQQPPGSQPAATTVQPDPTPGGPLPASAQPANFDSSGNPSFGGLENSPPPWATEDYERDGGPLGLGRGFLPNLAFDLAHDRIWVRSEFLAWWAKGFATPPLLTTSPAGTDASQAGVLGAPGTSVLFGGDNLQGGFHPGVRIEMGYWLSAAQNLGLEVSYLQLSRRTDYFNASGVSSPILARPFFNVETGLQDSQIVNFPGMQSGAFHSETSTQLQVAEVLARKNLNRQPGFEFDVLAGYRYQQLEDHLAVADTLSFSGTQAAFPAGSIVQQSDLFDARNVFQGGEIGASATFHFQRWTLDTLLKLAVGQTHTRVTIAGNTTTSIPGQATTTELGGLLALPSNIGAHDSDQFSVVPELGLTLGFDISAQLRGTIGYDLVYWNNVARPGDQIDLNIDPRQLPPAAITNATRPEFLLRTSDYWAQGLNLGLDFRF